MRTFNILILGRENEIKRKIANYFYGVVQSLTEKTSNTDSWTSEGGLEIF